MPREIARRRARRLLARAPMVVPVLALLVATSAAAAQQGPYRGEPTPVAPVDAPGVPGRMMVWNDPRDIFVPPELRSGVVAVDAGALHSVGLKADGSVHVGQHQTFRTDLYGEKTVPAEVRGATAVTAGWGHALAVVDGGVVAWGNNWFGQTDVPVQARSGVVAVSSFGFHSLALRADGSVVSWGSRDDVPPAARSGVSAIAAGGDYNLALKGGGVIAWGNNDHGQTDVPPAARSGVVAISAGWNTSVALTAEGRVLAWGNDEFGRATPPPTVSSGIVAIDAGWVHNVALTHEGRVIGWGYAAGNNLAFPPAWSSGVSAIAAHERFTVVLK
ncbi:Alpha-tubulin suppressor [Amycolatopsis arida]|uniref:Alpha-tubulin suppressor n=1 Tax=Amycolatopsis arida TaxID=587909 RepID=A0A1I5K7I0_9PSEU|nr:hypothetical protein [Amycolatopsis arida]TDX96918.1 alpha-tubulin suppressor-like RCC1 family protein [Amycolatopsis arida]SFO80928.1 Alpha-tubulin suppressor [Amycolatopsis arida]